MIKNRTKFALAVCIGLSVLSVLSQSWIRFRLRPLVRPTDRLSGWDKRWMSRQGTRANNNR